MAYIAGKFKYHSCYQGDEGLVLEFDEGASQTFKAGDLVKLSSGKVIIATASSTDRMLGFALADATGVTDSVIPVQVIRPSDVFIVNYQSDDAHAVANVGEATGFEAVTSANTWFINTDLQTATDIVFHVLGSPVRDVRGKADVTTLGNPAYVRFNPSNIEFGKDS